VATLAKLTALSLVKMIEMPTVAGLTLAPWMAGE